jgi:hypothetical protein
MNYFYFYYQNELQFLFYFILFIELKASHGQKDQIDDFADNHEYWQIIKKINQKPEINEVD